MARRGGAEPLPGTGPLLGLRPALGAARHRSITSCPPGRKRPAITEGRQSPARRCQSLLSPDWWDEELVLSLVGNSDAELGELHWSSPSGLEVGLVSVHSITAQGHFL